MEPTNVTRDPLAPTWEDAPALAALACGVVALASRAVSLPLLASNSRQDELLGGMAYLLLAVAVMWGAVFVCWTVARWLWVRPTLLGAAATLGAAPAVIWLLLPGTFYS